jgi:hypothetical protein
MPAMSDLSSVVLNTRLWTIVCLGALGVTVLLSLFGHLVGPRIWGVTPEDTRAAGQVMLPVFFGLFLVLGFSALPLMTNLAVTGVERMWGAMGLLERPVNAKVMALLRQHQVHFVLVVWGMFVAGLILAAPHMIREWREASSPPGAGGRGAPAGAMPPLEYQVRHARQILLLRTDMQNGVTRYGVLGLLKQTQAIIPANAPGLLDINTAGFELLGYRPAQDRPVVMFFSEPDSTGKTLFELLLPAPDGTMTYPAYAAPHDPAVSRTLTLDELRQIVAMQTAEP